jgi:putative aldouronate transport system permease protein
MVFMILITLYPFYYVLICSFSDGNYLIQQRGLMFFPVGFNLKAYKLVISNPNIISGYRATLIIVAGGTALNLLMTSFGAYALSRKRFAPRNIIMGFILFTMYFSGGLIPSYLLIYKYLNLGNNLLALILPGAISTWNLIIMRTNFAEIPDSLEEAALIDGANDFSILFKIILPLSKPVIAVMLLFYGVGHWNGWFGAMIYIRDRSLYPLQLILREILLLNSTDRALSGANMTDMLSVSESMKYATIIAATVPVLLAYPFLQKYFVKGLMIGAVKG